MSLLNLYFVGDSLNVIKNFPAKAKRMSGYQLNKVQNGQPPSDWKPMKSIGRNVKEIRIHQNGEYRIIYVGAVNNGVYVLHAFQKKSQQTSKKDMEMAKQRLKQIRNQND